MPEVATIMSQVNTQEKAPKVEPALVIAEQSLMKKPVLTVYPSLQVGAADDPLEREADATADNIMRMPSLSTGEGIQRKCNHCEEEKIQPKITEITQRSIQRESYDVDEENCTETLTWDMGCNFLANRTDGWNREQENAFMIAAKPVVENAFNNSNFRLRPQNPNYAGGWFRQNIGAPAGLMDATIPCPCTDGFLPKVNLNVYNAGVNGSGDWHVTIYRNTTGEVAISSSSASGELSGRLDEADLTYRSDIHQIPIVHEFGHSLGLDHPGEGVTTSGDDEYEHVGEDSEGRPVDGSVDLMGESMGLRPFYFDKWKDYLNENYPGCNFQIIDSTAPAPIARDGSGTDVEADSDTHTDRDIDTGTDIETETSPAPVPRDGSGADVDADSDEIPIQRKCADCVQEEKLQRKPTINFIQREEKVDSPKPEETDKLKSALSEPDYFELKTPFRDRNALHLWDSEAALGVWNYNYQFFKLTGVSDILARKAANITAPFAIDAQLKAGNPKMWEISDKELNTTSFVGTLPLFNFDANFKDWKFLPTFRKKLDSSVETRNQNYIQRKCTHCQEEVALRKPLASLDNNVVSDDVYNKIQSSRSSGSQMPEQTKSFMESRFGTDFNNVRIHNNENAAELSTSLQAKAFTTGNDIYFNSNQYSPNSESGKHLLAHELTHVVQQNGHIQREPLLVEPNDDEFVVISTLTPKASIKENIKILKQIDPDANRFLVVNGLKLHVYDNKDTLVVSVNLKDTFAVPSFFYFIDNKGFFYIVSIRDTDNALVYQGKRKPTTDKEKEDVKKLDDAFDYENWFLTDEDKTAFHKAVDKSIASMVVLPLSTKGSKGAKEDGPILSVNYPSWFKELKGKVETIYANDKKSDAKNDLLPESMAYYGSDKVQMNKGTDAWTIQVNKHKKMAFYTVLKVDYDKETNKDIYAAKVYGILKNKVKLINDTKDIVDKEQKEIYEIDGSGEKKGSKLGWAFKLKEAVQQKLDKQKQLEPKATDFPFSISLSTQGEKEEAQIFFRVNVQKPNPANVDAAPELLSATILQALTENDVPDYWTLYIRKVTEKLVAGKTSEDSKKEKADLTQDSPDNPNKTDEVILPPYPARIYARGMNEDRTTTDIATNMFRMVLNKQAMHGGPLINEVTIEMGQLTSYNWKVVSMPDEIKTIHEDPTVKENEVVDKTNDYVKKNKALLTDPIQTKEPSRDWDFNMKIKTGNFLSVSWANVQSKDGSGPKRATSWAGFPFSVFTPEELAKKHANAESNQIEDLKNQAFNEQDKDKKDKLLASVKSLEDRDKLDITTRSKNDLTETESLIKTATNLKDFISLRYKEKIPFGGNEKNDPFLVSLKALDAKMFVLYLMIKELYGPATDDKYAVEQYVEILQKQKKDLEALQKRIKRVTNNEKIHALSPQYRTVTALVKEDDGNVVPVLLIMCWHKDSTVKKDDAANSKYKMMLFDVTFDSPKKDDMVYVGEEKSNEADAARSVFVRFGKDNKYGDGKIVYRVPQLNLKDSTDSVTTFFEYLEYALAAIGITLLVAGAILSAGTLAPAAAAAIGTVVTVLGIATAVVGAAFAIRNIQNRREKGTFEFDASFALDIVNIIGAIVQPIAIAGKIGAAAKGANMVVKLAGAADKIARIQRLDKLLLIYDIVELGANSILVSLKVHEDIADIKALGLSKEKEDELMNQVAMEALQTGAMLAFSSLSKVKDVSDHVAARVENSRYKSLKEKGFIDIDGHITEHAPPSLKTAVAEAKATKVDADGKPIKVEPGKIAAPEAQGKAAWVEAEVLNMAKHPSAEHGHELTITEKGRIIRCSDFCSDLRMKYGKSLQDPTLDAEMAALEVRAKKAAESNNKAEADLVAKDAQLLEKKLIEIDTMREKLFGGNSDDWDKAISDIDKWEPGKVSGGKKPNIDGVKVPKRQRRLIDVLDLMNVDELAALGKGGFKKAMERINNVMGKKISDIDILKGHWEAVKKDLMGGKTAEQLGRDKMIELYASARGKFWDRVRKDPAAVDFLKKYGFGFENDGAPMAILGPKGKETTNVGNLTDQERRISLDHIVEKAQGDNWKKALDADNLEFMFQNANSWKEIVQVKFDMRNQPQTTTTVQPKLFVNSPNTATEKEADAMADKITKTPETSFIQKKCTECEHEDKLQRTENAASSNGFALNNYTSTAIENNRSAGTGLDAPIKSFMESRFGANFNSVRIHDNDKAAELSNNIQAKAFTTGNDIFFNKNQYNPNTESGKHLLAHELTHVVQQNGNVQKKNIIQRGFGEVRMAEGYYEIIAEIKARDVYKALNAHAKKLMEEIITRIGTVYQDWPNRLSFIRTLKTLFVIKEKTPEVVAKETVAATEAAVITETARVATPEAKKNLDLEEKASSNAKRKWTSIKGKFGGGTYYVDANDKKNIVVKAKVHLKPEGKGKATDVANIKSMEDAIEKHASTKGFLVDITFVDTPDAETFVAKVDTGEWEVATNWSGGDPKGFAHELIHMFAFEIDRYNYIDSHATNESMVIDKRLHWFNEQLKKPLDWDNPDSIMASGDHPLQDDVCRIAGLDMKTCLEERKSTVP